jgi:putative transposase
MVSFQGAHVGPAIMRTCVWWYVAYPLSSRQVEALREARGVCVDQATSTRGVRKYSPPLAAACHRRTHPVGMSWRLDETDSRVKGAWHSWYGAGETQGQTIALLLPAPRDQEAALRCLKQAMRRHGVPETITIAGSAANAAAIRGDNEAHGTAIIIRQLK